MSPEAGGGVATLTPPAPPPAGPARRTRRVGRLLRTGRPWLALAAVALVTALPVAFLVFKSFDTARPGQPPAYSLANWIDGFADPAVHGAAWNTITLSITRLAVAVPVALVLAWLIARARVPGGRYLEAFFWFAVFIPALPLTLGWILLLDPRSGMVNEVLRALPFLSGLQEGPLDIYGFWGIVWVQMTASTIPYVVVLTLPAFRRMGATLEDAARMTGASRFHAARTITLPVLLPSILAAVTISFIYTLQSFEVELLLGVPVGLEVYSTQIFDWIRGAPPRFGAATALGSAILVVLVLVALLYRRALRNREFVTVTAHSFSDRPMELGRIERWVAAALCWGFIAIAVVLPVGFVVIGSFMRRYGFFGLDDPFTTRHWQELLEDRLFVNGAMTSLLLGVLTTVVGVAVYFVIASIVVRSKLVTRGAIDTLAWLPIAIPGILLGLALLWLYLATPLRSVLYGNLLGLTLALVVGHMGTGTQQMKAALFQISADHEQAARVCGANPFRSTWRILLPLIAPAVASVAILTFASAVRDISTVVLLSGRGVTPLSILMLEFSSAGNLERGAALGVIISLFMLVFAVIARWIARRSAKSLNSTQ